MFAVLGFLGSGPGKIAMIVLAFALWTGFVANYAADAAWAKAEVACQEEVRARTDAEIARQNEATNSALVKALGRATEMEAERNELSDRIAGLVAGIRGAPTDGCRISDDLRRELLSIH